jgi:tetratricopeptide (TPR) repeat protein|tara:strand:+ start:575 stop:1024 length:450 start_codon:yes stop_codon:yes gene_type:complete
MKKFFIIIKIFFVYLFLISGGTAKESNYFKKGIELFQKKEFDKSKILFERDIVFYPKSEKSYLYLAKIFNNYDNDFEQEIKLNSVLLLNPQNDEAIYMLALLKIKQSDYNHAKKLLDEFVLVCKSFCSKKKEIQEKFEKMTSDDAKSNN